MFLIIIIISLHGVADVVTVAEVVAVAKVRAWAVAGALSYLK